MRTVEILHRVGDDDLPPLQSLFDAVRQAVGHEPLSDHLRLDLHHGGGSHGEGFAAIVMWGANRLRPLAYAQLSRTPASWLLQVLSDPAHPDQQADVVGELVAAALAEASTQGGGPLQWWVTQPTAVHDHVASTAGLVPHRELLQMRCTLPLALPGSGPPLSVRSFEPGRDEDEWLRVNNRAFVGHSEQGGWDTSTLAQRMAEDWFDPAGFLLHEEDGRLLGFCWTKVHATTEPPLGEIYVIGVDPDAHGRGLGRSLTRAGLDHLTTTGVRVGMLYVDSDNTTAVHLYRKLGLEVHRTDRSYLVELANPMGALPT